MTDRVISESFDQLTMKLGQLEALLLQTFGNAEDSFGSLSDASRSAYLSACTDLTQDCVRLADAISPVIYKKQEARHG